MRALLIVLNGAGVGGAPDAVKYHDDGADTLTHLFERRTDFETPALFGLGLGRILNRTSNITPTGSYGRMRAASPGKDTTTSQWEIAGVISQDSFAAFDRFPETLVQAIEAAANVKFIGNDGYRNGSLLDDLAAQHMNTSRPIINAAPGSVMQIFAHEEIIPRPRLHDICRIARSHCNTHRINRVIARPFTGTHGKFAPGIATREYPAIPPRTVLNAISEAGLHVDGIGRVGSIFARSGISRLHLTQSDAQALDIIENIWTPLHEGLVFASLDGSGIHGAQRNPNGFAEGLVQFDRWLENFLEEINPEDLLIITGDHGCDPTFPGTGHTREEVPLLVAYGGKAEALGTRATFADVAATLASYFHLEKAWRPGSPFFAFPRPRFISKRY